MSEATDDAIETMDRAIAALAAKDAEIARLLFERDHFEEALSQAYFLVVGQSPEWSNLFGTKEALDEIDSVIVSLTDAAALKGEEGK